MTSTYIILGREVRLKIVFNASTNIIGGGIQTATNFIFECLADSGSNIDWSFLLSAAVAQNLDSVGVDVSSDSRFHVFQKSPARYSEARRHALELVTAAKPTLVYTMSGPAYVRFPAFHVMGCSAPYVTHARLENYFSEGAIKGGFKLAESLVKLVYFHRADHLVFQTDSSRQGFLRRGLWKVENTSVISNAVGNAFTRALPNMKRELRGIVAADCADRHLQILIPSAYYSHKNLEIVVPTAKLLRSRIGDNFRILLTLPFNESWQRIGAAAAEAGVAAQIVNHGPFPVSDAPDLYQNSSILFLPTRLETFSASYLEAMWCGLPIVTSDLDFARDLCGEAAVYTDTLDPGECAKAIVDLLSNRDLQKRLISAGSKQVARFPTSHMRYQMIIDLLHRLSLSKVSIHNL